jgi:hypothetical protein
MGNGNVDTWHDRMYVHQILLVTYLLHRWHICNSCHIITMQLFKKSNMVDYGCMYDAYILSYKKHIFNSLATIIQLIDFLTWQFIY